MSEKTPKWPRDHSEKHSQAAKKGWRLRKHRQRIKKMGFGSGHHTIKIESEREKTNAALIKRAREAAKIMQGAREKRNEFLRSKGYRWLKDAKGTWVLRAPNGVGVSEKEALNHVFDLPPGTPIDKLHD